MGQSVVLKSPDEIRILHAANQIVARTLRRLEEMAEPGVTTADLDREAEKYCRRQGAVPAFKGYRGYPASLCVSVNREVVHGIPSRRRRLQAGDLVSIDFGVRYQGYYGDAAVTLAVGAVGEEQARLQAVTREALERGIAQVEVGRRISDISRAIQEYVEAHGFSVVRQFVGHGIGRRLHEPPEIPNYVREGASPRLQPGMVLAIEPMVNAGTWEVKVLGDGWTVVTADGRPSAHFEHSVAVTEEGPLVLSRLAEEGF